MTPNALTEILDRALGGGDVRALVPALTEAAETSEEAAWSLSILLETPVFRDHCESLASGLMKRWHTSERVMIALARSVARGQQKPVDEPDLGLSANMTSLIANLDAKLALFIGPESLRARANLAAIDRQKEHEAVRLFDEGTKLAPESGGLFFDRGIFEKRRREFGAAFQAFEKACTLPWNDDPESDVHDPAPRAQTRRAIDFNLALSALATGNAEAAFSALGRLGFAAERDPKTGMPTVPGLRTAYVRVPSRLQDSEDAGAGVAFESVPLRLISPIHGEVLAPTFGHTVLGMFDTILIDPIRVASHAQQTPVFPYLGTLASAGVSSWSFLALERREGELEALRSRLREVTLDTFLFEPKAVKLCPHCAHDGFESENPHEHDPHEHDPHEHTPAEEHKLLRGALLASGKQPAWVAAQWEKLRDKSGNLLLAIPKLFEDAQLTALAGKQHQTWGAISGQVKSNLKMLPGT